MVLEEEASTSSFESKEEERPLTLDWQETSISKVKDDKTSLSLNHVEDESSTLPSNDNHTPKSIQILINRNYIVSLFIVKEALQE